MLDNLPEIELKIEDDDSEGFVISGNGQVHLNGAAHLPKPLSTANNQQTAEQPRTTPSDTDAEQTDPKDWLEETIRFSTEIARQAQKSLARIKSEFLQTGMKFDTDFRDHFIYVATNRITESFDSFLIELPSEMKTADCTVHRHEFTTRYCPPNVELNGTGSTTALVKKPHPNDLDAVHRRFRIQNDTSQLIERPPITNASKENRINASKTVPKVARSSIPRSVISMRQWNGNNRLENGKKVTNTSLTENRVLPSLNLGRRTSVIDPMVVIPRNQSKSNAPNKSMTLGYNIYVAKPKAAEQPKVDRNVHMAPERVYERRKTLAGNLGTLKKSGPYNLRQSGADNSTVEQAIGQRRASRLKSSYAPVRSLSMSRVSRGPPHADERDKTKPNNQRQIRMSLNLSLPLNRTVPLRASRKRLASSSKQPIVELSTDEDDDDDDDDDVDPNEPRYCLCKRISRGKMIACDNDACPIEWFHFSCVGIRKPPKDKWYCPKCAQSMRGRWLRK